MDTEKKILDTALAEHFLESFSSTLREPFLILTSDLRVLGVNEAFLKMFLVAREDTVGEYTGITVVAGGVVT